MSEEKDMQQSAEEQNNDAAPEEKTSEAASEEPTAPEGPSDEQENPADARRQRVNEALGNLEEGARVVGEKTTMIAGQVFEKIKQGVSQAYQTGSKVVGELSDSASDYAEQYKTSAEIKKLSNEKNKYVAELGAHFYAESRKQNATWDDVAGSESATALFEQIENLEKQIVEVGKRLDAGNEGDK